MLPRTTFSVVFFCKKTKVTKKGKAPIYARITQLTANKYHRLLRYMTEYIRDIFCFCTLTGLAFTDVDHLRREHFTTDEEG